MFNWSKISLYKFQQIDLINKKSLSDSDKTLEIICVVFDLTEYELNNLPLNKVSKYISQIKNLLKKEPVFAAQKTIDKFSIDYEISKLNFGQYIDLVFFLQQKIQNAHYALASIVSKDADAHKERAEYFKSLSILQVWGSLNEFIDRFNAFNKEYKSLFDSGDEQTSSKFQKRYGWIYSASQVAEYERITLYQAFELPIRRALNGLAYLKAKAAHDIEMRRQKKQQLV